MLKDYIRALQTSFTTVTGLRDALIKIFGKIDEDFTSLTDKVTPTNDMLASGTINTSYTNVLYRVGDLCYLTLRINGATVDADATCFTLPEGFRPSIDTYVDCTASGVFRQATIKSTGAITIPNAVSNNNITFFCTYYAG